MKQKSTCEGPNNTRGKPLAKINLKAQEKYLCQ